MNAKELEACLSHVVQREALGLPSADVRKEYDVSDEIWNGMGAAGSSH